MTDEKLDSEKGRVLPLTFMSWREEEKICEWEIKSGSKITLIDICMKH